jgi:hypothetical protein
VYRTRVEVAGYGEFDAREWLRRDVLWASLMSPYHQQINDLIIDDGYVALQQHNGNVSRRETYAGDPSPNTQALAFFHQGKNIAGLLSSAALLRTYMHGYRTPGEHPPEVLDIQASCVDIALGSMAKRLPNVPPDDEAYLTCSRQAQAALSTQGQFGSKSRLLRASNIMCALAKKEAEQWMSDSGQNSQGTLPTLTIKPGGSPRSAGTRVEALQPIFQAVLGSGNYQSLRPAA